MQQIALILAALSPLQDDIGVDPLVLEAETARIEVVNRLSPTVVAIFGEGGNGGGSGVLISPDGFVLTNFHVTSGAGTFMKCGLSDGVLYDGVIVGIDPTGDVALVKLLGRTDFPFAKLGDSDQVKVGDWSFAMGNPFLLATDFRPTVTYGIVSGVHRYQYPAGTFLEYTDCIQIDTSINPGNSGGPLFSASGELIGINGRGSFEKRGRVNSGAGYAISINQIKNFMDHLRAGRVVDHATMGATVLTSDDGTVIVSAVLEESEAFRRGLREGDELVSFAGRSLGSVNQFKNILGIYPKGWKVPIVFRRANQRFEASVRLRGLHTFEELNPKPQPRPNQPRPDQPKPDEPKPDEPKPETPPMPMPIEGRMADPLANVPENLKQFFEKKEGFTNFYFNRLEQTRAMRAIPLCPQNAGRWKLSGMRGEQQFTFTLSDNNLGLQAEDIFLQELKIEVELKEEPEGTGGLLLAMHHLRTLLAKGTSHFTEFYYLGSEPFGESGKQVDVLVGQITGAHSYWYVDKESGVLLGMRFELTPDIEPCELLFSDWKDFSGIQFPSKIESYYLDKSTAVYEIKTLDFAASPTEKKSE